MLNIVLPSNKIYAMNSNYKIVLKDQFENPISGKELIINNVNVTSNSNGEITFNIDFNTGNHKLTILNPLNNETVTDNIQIIARLTDNLDITMYCGANKYYKVRAFDDYGNVASGETINIIINGKSYTVKTDKNGVASVGLNKFKVGKYTVAVNYKGFKVSNKITVKSTLSAKNKSVKKGKTVKFSAKLVNVNGKPLKAKKVTFKIKGKTYKVKTNKKGIATLKLKKLKPGKYTVRTSYGNVKISNKLIIRK